MAYNLGYDDITRDPRDAARKTWGGWLFVVSLVLGGIVSLAGFSPLDGKAAPQGLVSAILIFAGAGIAAFLAWRVRTGNGWLAGSVLLVWWIAEMLFKLISGTVGIVWIAIILVGMVNLALGIRACWQLRGVSTEDVDLVATFE